MSKVDFKIEKTGWPWHKDPQRQKEARKAKGTKAQVQEV